MNDNQETHAYAPYKPLPSGKIAVAPSLIHGSGVFVKTPVQRGQRLIDYRAYCVRGKADTLQQLQISADFYMQVREGSVPTFINHSCRPNCFIRFDDGVYLEAAGDIASDQELTIDYNCYYFDVGDDLFQCKCRNTGCNGYAMGFRHLSIERMQLVCHCIPPVFHQVLLQLMGHNHPCDEIQYVSSIELPGDFA